jgi:hypothetical protein
VILAQLAQRRIRAFVLLDAGVLQHQVEVQPAARPVIGGANHGGIVDVARRFLFRRGQP